MVWNYKEIIKKYKSLKKLQFAINNRELFKVMKGIYSDEEFPDELSIVAAKYKEFVVTMQSGFSYYDLSDYHTEKPTITILESSYRKNSDLMKRYYSNKLLYNLGAEEITYNNRTIKMYNKERLLIELIRKKNEMSMEEYFHVFRNIRERKNELDISLLMEYASNFKEYDNIQKTIRESFM